MPFYAVPIRAMSDKEHYVKLSLKTAQLIDFIDLFLFYGLNQIVIISLQAIDFIRFSIFSIIKHK
jgi:hypothetical protein